MHYSHQQIETLLGAAGKILPKTYNFLERLHARSYKTERGREFAFNGFGRRLRIIGQCIQNVFRLVPPSRKKPLSTETLFNADINLHAFVFNVFGSIDNLAWILAHECLSSDQLAKLDHRHVNLNNERSPLRVHFSQHFCDYLVSRTDWFRFQENYRHALAHRIPLYVPPFAVPTSNQGEYQSLGTKLHDALSTRDFDEIDRLELARKSLSHFQPVMIHSFGERSSPILFHFQILSDFETVEEFAEQTLLELDRAISTHQTGD